MSGGGGKGGHHMTMGNTSLPNTQTDQDNFPSACFHVRRSPGGWDVLKLAKFVMRVEVLPL